VGKRWTWVAWSILAIFAAGTIVTAALAIPNRSVALDPAGVLYLLDFTAFLVVGALIVARQPDNAIDLECPGRPDVSLMSEGQDRPCTSSSPVGKGRQAGA
jgi:hypothetical protein